MALSVILGCAAFLPLSLFAVKSAVYLYSLLPAWAVAAAVGAAAVAGRTARPGPVTLLVAIASSPPVVHAAGGIPPPLAAWASAWLAAGVALTLARLRPGYSPAVAVAVCAFAVTGGLVRQSQRLTVRYHDPGYRAVARGISARLAGVPPDRPAFVAPEAPTFAYLLFRSGRYWGTPREPWTPERRAAVVQDTTLRVFIVDPRRSAYGGWPDSTTVAWLEESLQEITRDLESESGRRIAVRVFVR